MCIQWDYTGLRNTTRNSQSKQVTFYSLKLELKVQVFHALFQAMLIWYLILEQTIFKIQVLNVNKLCFTKNHQISMSRRTWIETTPILSAYLPANPLSLCGQLQTKFSLQLSYNGVTTRKSQEIGTLIHCGKTADKWASTKMLLTTV